MLQSVGTWWMWTGFIIFVLLMLWLDISLMHGGRAHKVSFKEASIWSIIWVILALLFCLLIHYYLGASKALEFLTGYLIEKSLSVDNLFVFLMLFNYFQVPNIYQRRILLYGILGAIIMRAVMIFLGTWLISYFHWLLYIFGLFLVISGIKMWLLADEKPDLSKNKMLIWLRKHLKITNEFHGEKFWIKINNVRHFTPLFLVLILIEITDLVFAVDSIPAIFAITLDPFIVFTSNIFAILGLRALYFLLAGMAERFHLLKYGLAIILAFVGSKMLLMDIYKIPVGISLAVIATILILSIILSLKEKHEK